MCLCPVWRSSPLARDLDIYFTVSLRNVGLLHDLNWLFALGQNGYRLAQSQNRGFIIVCFPTRRLSGNLSPQSSLNSSSAVYFTRTFDFTILAVTAPSQRPGPLRCYALTETNRAEHVAGHDPCRPSLGWRLLPVSRRHHFNMLHKVPGRLSL